MSRVDDQARAGAQVVDTLDSVQADETPTGHRPGGAERRQFAVCGDTPLAYRLVEELVTRYDGDVTAIVRSRTQNWGPQIGQIPGVEVVEADRLDADAFARAGLAGTAALALVDQDDVSNVDAALLAQELNPAVRIVIRMSNRSLGERMSRLLNNCVTLSAAAIAAPAFVAAALDETSTAPMQIAGRTFVATSRGSTRPDQIACGLAVVTGQDEPEVLPSPEVPADLVLASSSPAPSTRRQHRQRSVGVLSILFGGRLRLVLGALVVLLAAATAALAWVRHVGWAQAAYVALLTELGGPLDVNPHAPSVERITLTILTVVSIALIPALTAAVVDSTVRARLRLEAGGLVEPISDHIVVVGLGNVGTRVIRAFNESGVDVVAIERDSSARGIQVARELRIPVIIGDASRTEVLTAASVNTCRALVIVSTDDVANLETALLGRTAKPDLRVIIRLFDGEFADRVQRAFSITASRSVSYLAAPAFAAAMLGRQIIATIPVQRRVLLVAELPVAAGSALDGQSVAATEYPHQARLLAVRIARDGTSVWFPPAEHRLASSDHLVVVATRTGFAELLAAAAPPVDVPAEGSPPAPRQVAAEGPDDHRPFGPADAGSTRPA